MACDAYLQMVDVPLKSKSMLAISCSMSSFSLSAMITTTPPPALSLATDSCFRRDVCRRERGDGGEGRGEIEEGGQVRRCGE